MSIVRWVVFGLLVLLAIMATGVALVIHGHTTGWIVAKRSVPTWVEALKPHVQVVRPEGAGPFPVMPIFSGCGGVRPNHMRWARLAAEEGFLGVVVDGFAARQIGRERALREICSGTRLWGRERAGDVVASLSLIETLPEADPSRVVLFGQSHGAWAIMDLLAMDLDRKGPTGLRPPPAADVRDGVVASVLFYPYCGYFSLTDARGWQHAVPSLMIVPQEDTIVSALACQDAAEKLIQAGMSVDLEVLPGVDHGFDQVEHDPRGGLVYRPEITKAMESRVRDFLRAVRDPA